MFVRLHVMSALFAAGCSLAAAQTSSLPGRFIAKSTPEFIHAATTKNLGPEDQSKIIDVSLWLNLHNRPGLDALAEELYDPNSSHFRNWLTREEFVRQYAPAAAEAAQVAGYVRAHGLRVTSVGPDNMFVRAQGSVAAVSKAFRVSLDRYQMKDKIYRANSGDPFVEGAIAALVSSVSGLYDYPMVASLVTAPFSAPSYTSNCFPGTTTETITGAPGNYPYVPITGNKYVSSPKGPDCGYTPSEIQVAYNLKALYAAGFDGTGQTIVIIAWCGSPSIRQDASAFSARFGLPPLTASNFHIINNPGPSSCAGVNPQINRDVEWAHSVAPGANITLVVAPSPMPQDIDQAEYYAVLAGLGNVISGSYGTTEHYQSPTEVLNENLINEVAAIFGISANFPVGDSPSDDFWWVWAPATSPYATAIGGTTLALNKGNSMKWQTGFGSYALELIPSDVLNGGGYNLQAFNGSSGGPSELFAKPAYQKNLPYTTRMAPDIAWLADSFTGALVEVTLSSGHPPVLQVYGGTGLACTMFSALWAIANQEAGSALGQAAPYLYSMPKATITDMTIIRSKTNPVGWIYYSSTNRQPVLLQSATDAYSAIWDQNGIINQLVMGDGEYSGAAGPGWDRITGLGAPNAKPFADYFNPAR